MRVILTQNEIEAAIRQAVFNQITVKEGQDISIEFRATRGDDGATAEVTITSLKEGPRTGNAIPLKSTEKVMESGSKPQATKIQQTTNMTTAAPDVTETTDSTSETEVSVEDASTNSKPEAGNQVEETEAEAPFTPPSFLTKGKDEPVTKPVAAASTGTANKSLFANLSKPVNPKT